MKYDQLTNLYLEAIAGSPEGSNNNGMKNKNDVIIDKYIKYTQAIYNNLHQIRQLIESEGYEGAVKYDQEAYDGDNNLVGYFGAYLENLVEGFRD
jgi:hypothetical protein